MAGHWHWVLLVAAAALAGGLRCGLRPGALLALLGALRWFIEFAIELFTAYSLPFTA